VSKALAGKMILLVEDEADLREPISEELMYFGAKVLQAANGQEALRLLEANPIDAIVSDVRMPGGDGVELLKNVNA
jgi:CheY-like chemotaxis protein